MIYITITEHVGFEHVEYSDSISYTNYAPRRVPNGVLGDSTILKEG